MKKRTARILVIGLGLITIACGSIGVGILAPILTFIIAFLVTEVGK